MAAPIIPIRPNSGKYELRYDEMNCLNWVVLTGASKEDAFLRFVRPDYLGSKSSPAVKEAVKQFFALSDVRDYMEAYRQTILDFSAKNEEEEDPEEDMSIDEQKSLAMKKLVEYILSEANNISTADDPKAILDYANKIGIFDMQEQAEEKPRRYLPETCDTCRYRIFIEENCDEVPDETENTNLEQ